MAARKKYTKAEPKQHGSNNIYIDAALEAMAQAREENGKLSYMIVVHDPETCGVQLNGDICGVAATLAHFAKKDKGLHELVTLLKYGTKEDKDREQARNERGQGQGTSAIDNFFEALTRVGS